MKLAALFAFAALLSAQVEFPASRVPAYHWARELVWLRNIGVTEIDASGAPPEFVTLAGRAGLSVRKSTGAVSVSLQDPLAQLKGRVALAEGRAVLWTGLESEASPVYRKGAVSFSGEEESATVALRREAALRRYWPPFQEARHNTMAGVTQLTWPKASALSVVNSSASVSTRDIAAFLPSYKKSIRVPGVRVPAHDALLLPIDVPLSDPSFCRGCSGMSNSERLLYATSELTATEYENGILSFDFYAPVSGVVLLQLEREPVGPMLAAGHPMAFDWDPESKRLRMPIPEGRGVTKRVRIAIAVSAPDESASFAAEAPLIIGETNRVMTEYSSLDTAKRSRLLGPAGWKVTREDKPPLQVEYSISVPADKLHGTREDLRLETDGVTSNHARVQLLRPVSLRVRETFDVMTGLAPEPPLVDIENANGRSLSVLVRNNAPEIRSFHLKLSGDGLEFVPAEMDVAVGASVEREISVRVFAHRDGLLHAMARVTGAAVLDAPIDFVAMAHGETATYERDLLGTGGVQKVWESSKVRVVFDGARWVEFYAKQNGKNLLPAEGAVGYEKAAVTLVDGTLTIAGGPEKMPALLQFPDVPVVLKPKEGAVGFELKSKE